MNGIAKLGDQKVADTRVFVSYSWDSSEHKDWVRKLADSLEEIDELHVVWDGYDLDAMTDKNLFMESGIHGSAFVLIVATAKYKQKADTRKGGVGIETYLATSVHWDGLQKNDKTKVIVLLREPDSVPIYLKGHLYVDFTDSHKYDESLSALLSYFLGASKLARPMKRRALAISEHLYTFTKAEDLIRVTYKRRRAIVDAKAGTDFSGSNRIKYELWETQSPTVGYILALSDNINIAQTVNHAIEKFKSNKLQPKEITVVRPRPGRPEHALIASLFAASGSSAHIHEYTYKDYIWDFCIDESLKGMDPPSVVPNYTDQSLVIELDDEQKSLVPLASDFFVDLLQQVSTASAHLVVAPGGMGKTSLCLSVAARLHNRQDLHSSVILIQAEAIKKYVADQGLVSARIDTIFQLYELYARHHRFDQIFDKVTFELAVLCGNLIVIIDGLDEFVSLFPENFNLDSFLVSLRSLHLELGSSAVLLTTRNQQIIDDERLAELTISRYELLGFDSRSCEKYVQRRLKSYSDVTALVAKVQAQIEKVRLHDQEGRVVPFFADIAVTVLEDGLREKHTEDFEVEDDPTPYPSNNDLTDHIIHSVMRREETRHGLDVSVLEVVHLISGLVAQYGVRWPPADMRDRLALLYDKRSETLYSKITLNPLILQKGNHVELRYSFLASYFEVVHLLDGILNRSLEVEFVRALGKLSVEANEFRELKRYFQSNRENLKICAKALLASLKTLSIGVDATKASERERSKRAISSLLNLIAQVFSGSTSHVTEHVLHLYGIDSPVKEPTTLDGLYVRGDFPSFDFSYLTVMNSEFERYTRFLSCKFDQTRFMYCTFDACFDSGVRSSALDASAFESSCELGDLREFLTLSRADKKDENLLVISEAKKFLHCFFKGDRFTDNRKAHVKFSNKVPGLSDKQFDRLVALKYLSVKREKEIDTFYEVSEDFRPSVRKLLTDNYPDASMKRFLAFIRQ